MDKYTSQPDDNQTEGRKKTSDKLQKFFKSNNGEKRALVFRTSGAYLFNVLAAWLTKGSITAMQAHIRPSRVL